MSSGAFTPIEGLHTDVLPARVQRASWRFSSVCAEQDAERGGSLELISRFTTCSNCFLHSSKAVKQGHGRGGLSSFVAFSFATWLNKRRDVCPESSYLLLKINRAAKAEVLICAPQAAQATSTDTMTTSCRMTTNRDPMDREDRCIGSSYHPRVPIILAYPDFNYRSNLTKKKGCEAVPEQQEGRAWTEDDLHRKDVTDDSQQGSSKFCINTSNSRWHSTTHTGRGT
ncbi:hypothetical protein INR49_014933 [Caranx melampygus]|nr:hypothetical protein INR49_014933 [Caranx melampygus]